jgi:hypothetical protein
VEVRAAALGLALPLVLTPVVTPVVVVTPTTAAQ